MRRIILIISSLSLISLLTIYSVSSPFLGRAVFLRQLIWLGVSLPFFFFFMRFNYQKLWGISYPLYIFSILLLVCVLFLGEPRGGATRWLQISFLNFQPSELAKFSLVLFLSRYYSRRPAYDLNLFYSLILPFLFVLVTIILIFVQPDLGTAMILLIIFMAFLFIAKVKPAYILGFVLTILVLSPLIFLLLEDYQKQRLLVFLNPNRDPLGAGYTITQSKIAIGSGRFLGKGWLSGTQSQLRFLPAAYTDFTFSSFSEEWGFLGSIILVFFYYQLIKQILLKSSIISEAFGRLISYGIFFMLSSQIMINICMSLGLLPVVGTPLPFFSYGGSNLLMNFISLGVLLNIIRRRGSRLTSPIL